MGTVPASGTTNASSATDSVYGDRSKKSPNDKKDGGV